ncbi:hypothetical protein LXA43DRAFT_157344 [Ganoderma leucocontextum]|nr:hypothetical protein LXA43DRAFT_157344 [Ganoderma leucocontextum]
MCTRRGRKARSALRHPAVGVGEGRPISEPIGGAALIDTAVLITILLIPSASPLSFLDRGPCPPQRSPRNSLSGSPSTSSARHASSHPPASLAPFRSRGPPYGAGSLVWALRMRRPRFASSLGQWATGLRAARIGCELQIQTLRLPLRTFGPGWAIRGRGCCGHASAHCRRTAAMRVNATTVRQPDMCLLPERGREADFKLG